MVTVMCHALLFFISDMVTANKNQQQSYILSPSENLIFISGKICYTMTIYANGVQYEIQKYSQS